MNFSDKGRVLVPPPYLVLQYFHDGDDFIFVIVTYILALLMH